jgi:hypothetical protein
MDAKSETRWVQDSTYTAHIIQETNEKRLSSAQPRPTRRRSSLSALLGNIVPAESVRPLADRFAVLNTEGLPGGMEEDELEAGEVAEVPHAALALEPAQPSEPREPSTTTITRTYSVRLRWC